MYRNTYVKQMKKKNNHNDKKKQDYSNLIMNVIRSNHVKRKKNTKKMVRKQALVNAKFNKNEWQTVRGRMRDR